MPTKTKPVYWIGEPPTRCDFDQIDLKGEFIDGATVQGPWAIMCPTCHKKWGLGLGTGRGQRFVRQKGSRFMKVSG